MNRSRPMAFSILVLAFLVLTHGPQSTGAAAPTAQESTSGAPASQIPAEPPLRWFKGNTHTHTLNSDGDSTPDEVVRWYREHGYHFLVLTDHNYLTSVGALNALHGADDQFLIIKGEEVTDRFETKPLHINGLDVVRAVDPQGGTSVVDVLQRNVDAIRRAEGVPHINHPNFGWAITPEELAAVERTTLFEIFNGHPLVNNAGGGGQPSLEEMWDLLLTRGRRLYGLATDDAHHFKQPWNSAAARPGQGWIVVRAARLAATDLLGAMERGEFYASTGVELEDLRIETDRMTVRTKLGRTTLHRVHFIGADGKLLAEVTENPAVYVFKGDEAYVRATVTDSNGRKAWVQPVFRTAR